LPKFLHFYHKNFLFALIFAGFLFYFIATMCNLQKSIALLLLKYTK